MAQGQPALGPEWASALDADPLLAAAPLTEREREVLSLYASGLGVKQVARALFVSENTIDDHLRRIRSIYQQIGRPPRRRSISTVAAWKTDICRPPAEADVGPSELASRRIVAGSAGVLAAALVAIVVFIASRVADRALPSWYYGLALIVVGIVVVVGVLAPWLSPPRLRAGAIVAVVGYGVFMLTFVPAASTVPTLDRVPWMISTVSVVVGMRCSPAARDSRDGDDRVRGGSGLPLPPHLWRSARRRHRQRHPDGSCRRHRLLGRRAPARGQSRGGPGEGSLRRGDRSRRGGAGAARGAHACCRPRPRRGARHSLRSRLPSSPSRGPTSPARRREPRGWCTISTARTRRRRARCASLSRAPPTRSARSSVRRRRLSPRAPRSRTP